MAIASMTGFARVQARVSVGGEEQLSYTLTVKSVNHRFLDLQFRLPLGLDLLEIELRRMLKENLIRGHVDLTLSVDRNSQAKAGYNRELISGYLAAFDAARSEHRLVSTAAGPKPVAVLREARFKHRGQHLKRRLLDEPIQYRRDAQLAGSPVRLRDLHAPD